MSSSVINGSQRPAPVNDKPACSPCQTIKKFGAGLAGRIGTIALDAALISVGAWLSVYEKCQDKVPDRLKTVFDWTMATGATVTSLAAFMAVPTGITIGIAWGVSAVASPYFPAPGCDKVYFDSNELMKAYPNWDNSSWPNPIVCGSDAVRNNPEAAIFGLTSGRRLLSEDLGDQLRCNPEFRERSFEIWKEEKSLDIDLFSKMPEHCPELFKDSLFAMNLMKKSGDEVNIRSALTFRAFYRTLENDTDMQAYVQKANPPWMPKLKSNVTDTHPPVDSPS